MPGIVKVKIIEGRNLPVMDRSADTTDAYVELKLGSITYKTDVFRKSLNPHWNTEWYKFEMADADLQDEPLQVRVMDYDTYSANDLIGKVYFNLNPLLVNSTSEIRNVLKTGLATSPGSGCISGWFPIYDTIYGLRGEINVIIKLELFSDFNKFRQSSCGVHIFCCSMIPHGYYTENIYGFVEELVVEDDPEYQWIEKIRSPRASNEARQAIFYKMSGVLQRKIGMKVVEMGGNAVIGYRQCFDLEGETGGVVVRGIGTAVKLNRYKKLDNLVRNSLYNDFKFKIPDLFVTSAFDYNRNIHSDACSVFSLTDSLHSDKCLSDFALDDRWSLCSFASRTSSNSRYTSVETLLDQTDRNPIAKSSSKLLSVARYFTSSKLRRKFSQKKKQKSILRRKFSVIEEYKQKSNSSLGADIDDMVQESMNSKEGSERITRLKECILERIPTVEENATCMIFDKSQSNRSMHFNMSACSSLKNKNESNLDFDDCMKTDDHHFSVEEIVSHENCEKISIQSSLSDETPKLGKCKISETDNYELYGSVPDDNQQTSDHSADDEVSRKTESSCTESDDVKRTNLVTEHIDDVSEKLNVDERFRRTLMSRSTSFTSQDRCSTPPISEMTPYSMSPPLNNSPIVNPVTLPNNVCNAKSIGFERNFLKILRRKHIGDYFSISNSPEIRRLGLSNEVPEADNLKVSNTNDTEEFETEKMEKVTSDSWSTDSLAGLPNNLPSSGRVHTQDTEPLSKLEADNVSHVESLDLDYPLRVDYPVSECRCINDPVNNFNYLNTNETNCNVRITTADDNCNILREALTPSRLLMHANNPDRNISEGDKEEDPSKREGLPTTDQIVKNKSLPDTGVIVKSNFRIKDRIISETSQENESIESSNSTDYKGYNVVHKENMELMEYPFFTLSTYPEDFIIHLGGTVSARSVKLLDRISNTEEPETRDAWWTELRVEIKSHMRTLACNAVLNYMENTSICDEVCLLSASGTAALVKIYDGPVCKMTDEVLKSTSVKNLDTEENKSEKLTSEDIAPTNCSVFHIPYRKSSLPFPVNIKTCEVCKKGFVADVTFLTIEPLDRIPVIGQGAFVYAFVYRSKRDCKSELNAREISEGLPFLEYELNRQLITKLRIKGMNSLFGLNVHVSIGEKMIAAYATGTAMLLSPLPIPPELTLVTNGKYFMQHPTSKKKLSETRKLVKDAIKKNKIEYQLADRPAVSEVLPKINADDITDDISIQDLYPDMEYFAGSKQTCVIEVDDKEDLQVLEKLLDPYPPQGFFVSATERIQFGSLPYIPKKNIQLIAQVYRYRISSNLLPVSFNDYFHRIVQALYNKIQHRIPCSLNKISFKVNIPEADELQIRIVGMALALKESEKSLASVSTSCSSVSELADDYIINADSEKDSEQGETLSTLTPIKQHSKKRSDIFDNEIHLTSLSYIPGATISYYLGNLNFVFIRESTLVKETGGANSFVNNFLSDVSAVVKSHAAGIGGNAVVNFFLNECLLTTHSHKNQGQCLSHVGGDVVRYVYRNPSSL